MILVDQDITHFFTETCVREHADLISDMIPGARSTDLFQGLPEEISHADDSLSNNISELNLPFIEVVLVVENFSDNCGSVFGGT